MSRELSTVRAGAEWFLGHGLGNDYLVFEEAAEGVAGMSWRVTPEPVRRVCDRQRGLGSDGIVVSLAREGPAFRLRMFNPDGSEFERSGNGLRVFAAWAFLTRRVAHEPFAVEVGGGTVVMTVHGDASDGRAPGGALDVSVEMGRARVSAEAVAFDAGVASVAPGTSDPVAADGSDRGSGSGASDEDGDVRIRIPLGDAGAGAPAVEATPVSVGNPHCVVFPDRVDEEALDRLGPALATHPAFREGVNVQLVEPLDRRRVRALIWERGVGRTTSSGTSSCAVAVAAVRRDLVEPGEVEVVMEGGSFRVTVGPDEEVTLRGPVQAVARGRLEDTFVRELDAGTWNARS